MIAELLSVGTELLLGQIVDTNTSYLSQKLAEIGVSVYFKQTVGDNVERMKEVMKSALMRADVIIISGGLGPTEDDCTRQAVAEFTGKPLQPDSGTIEKLRGYFSMRGIDMPKNNEVQGYFPESSKIIINPRGTAPGFMVEKDRKFIFALPGVPGEFKGMTDDSVIPMLLELSGERKTIKSRVIKTIGMSESKIAEILKDLFMEYTNPTIAYLAGDSGISIRLTAMAENAATADSMIAELEAKVRGRLKKIIYGTDDMTLEEIIGHLMRDKGFKLAIAESCTGGLIANRITDVAGSSEYFERGYVTYSNSSKAQELGVPGDTIVSHGAVSEEVALAMAEGVRKLADTDIGIGVTGIAGPGGGTEEKPVGLVYIALATEKYACVKHYRFPWDRKRNKHFAALMTLDLLRKYLMGYLENKIKGI